MAADSPLALPSSPTVPRRLVDLPVARKQLLAAIAAAPAGEKLSIPRLRDALVSQADVLDLLQRMVAGGELDRATLRPPERKVAAPRAKLPAGMRRGQSVNGEPGGALYDALIAEGARRGMSAQRISLTLWGNKARIHGLKKNDTVRRKTADKIHAWIADRPAEAAKATSEPPASPTPAVCDLVTPVQLKREIDAFCAEHKIAPTRFGKDAMNDAAFVRNLPGKHSLKPKTVTRIRAFIAAGPRRRAPLGDRRYSENRRDPTKEPSFLAEADRAGAAKARTNAAVNRRVADEAERRLNGEKFATAESPAVRAAKQQILDCRDYERRQGEPVERAKLALQRKGRSVYSAAVHGGPKDRFHVSGERDGNGRLKELTPAELIALAERITGQTFRSAA